MVPKQILVVDDDSDTRNLIVDVLTTDGYWVLSCSDGEQALNELLNHRGIELVIADIKMPKVSGIEFLLKIREMGFDVKVIIMTAYATVTTAVQALRGQAFDYMTKPFSLTEFRERVRQALDISVPDEAGRDIQRYRDLTIDQAARRVWMREREIHLTRLEFDLLAHLIDWQGYAISIEQMLDEVWECEGPGRRSRSTVKSCVSRLRAKLGDDPSHPVYIRNIWGVGYQFGD